MQSIWKTITRMLALMLAFCMIISCASASEMDSSMTVSLISIKTQKLNPLLAVERDFQSLTALIYESLVTIDDNYLPQPCLATKWEASDNLKDWTFTLRDDAYFSDGTQVTAYDAAATITEILRLAADETADNHGVYSSLKYVATKASANDARTLVVRCSRPYWAFIYAMTFPVLKADEVAADNPIGSGAYKALAFSPADYLYLSPNEYWWGNPPMVQEINALFVDTNKNLTAMFEYNRADAIISRAVTAAQYRSGVSNVSLDFRTRELDVLMLNLKAFPLDSLNVRRAIRYAINPDVLGNSAYYGMVVRTDTPLPPGTWLYDDGTSGDDSYTFNPEKARELLQADGWEDADGNGVLDMIRNGKRVNLHLQLYVYEEAENSVRVEAANQIKDMLSAIGIDVNVNNVSYARAKEKLEAGTCDMCLAAFQMDAIPDPGFLLIGPNTGNYGRYKSDEMNNLFKSLRSAKSQQEYAYYIKEIQRVFTQDCPFICLFYRAGAVLTRKMYTNVRDVREPEVLKGIESIGTK